MQMGTDGMGGGELGAVGRGYMLVGRVGDWVEGTGAGGIGWGLVGGAGH